VEIRELSGSLLIHHEEQARLEDRLAETGLFRFGDVPAFVPPVLDRITEGVQRSDRALERRTGGRANLRTLMILVLVMLAIFQTFRGRILVPAISLLFFAANLALMGKDRQQDSHD
jgi:hypothetical protein